MVGIRDEVLKVLPSDTPHAAAADLEGTQLASLDKRVNLVSRSAHPLLG